MTDPSFWFVTAGNTSSDTWVAREDGESYDEFAVMLDELLNRSEPQPAAIKFVVVNEGRHRGDLLWCAGGPCVIASERFCMLLEQHGLSGWFSVPVEIVSRKHGDLAGYRLLLVTGRCADFLEYADDDSDEITGSDGGVVVDPAVGWDTTDLFWARPETSFTFLTTQRVRELIERAGMERITFERPVV